MSDPVAAEEPLQEPAPERVRSRRVSSVLAVLLAVVAIVLAFVSVSLQRELEAERGERREVARVAGAFSAAILTFDADDLEATKERVLALSTGEFAAEFEEGFGGLAELVQAASSTARASVDDVFVGDVDDGQASAITIVDLTASGRSGPRTVADTYLRLSLVRVDGEWRVDGVTSLNFAQTPAGGDAGGGG